MSTLDARSKPAAPAVSYCGSATDGSRRWMDMSIAVPGSEVHEFEVGSESRFAGSRFRTRASVTSTVRPAACSRPSPAALTGFLNSGAHVARALLEERHALVHPLRPRLAEQVVVEELVHVDGPVLHVVAVAQAVRLAVVVEHVGLLAEPPHRRVELDALVPRHRIVRVVVDRQVRRVDLLDPEDRRVLDELQRRVPRRRADAALRLLVLELRATCRCPSGCRRRR